MSAMEMNFHLLLICNINNLNYCLYLLLFSISDDLNGISFGIDDEGNYGYIKAGADTVTPFKTGSNIQPLTITTGSFRNQNPCGYILSDVSVYKSMNIKITGQMQYQPLLTIISIVNGEPITLLSKYICNGWGSPNVDETLDITNYNNISLSIDSLWLSDDRYNYLGSVVISLN